MTDDKGREDIERRLQGYFAAERDALRAPSDLWANVSARLGEQDPAPWWRRVFGGATHGMGRLYAGAAAALAVAVVGAVMYAALIGIDGSGVSQESMAADAPVTTAAASMAAAPALPPTAAPAAAPVAAAAEMAPAPAMDTAMADSVPRAPAELTQNASAAMAQPDEQPFRLEMWGLQNGARTHLFWVDLPEGWISGAPMLVNGEWSGAFSGRGVTLHYTFGERVQTDLLRANSQSAAAAGNQRVWDEYVIGNLAFIVAPPERAVGDLRMTLQLPSGTLRLTGDALTPEQQGWALVIFRSIIA